MLGDASASPHCASRAAPCIPCAPFVTMSSPTYPNQFVEADEEVARALQEAMAVAAAEVESRGVQPLQAAVHKRRRQ